jgi:hypothetical protein
MSARPTDQYLGREPQEAQAAREHRVAAISGDPQAAPRMLDLVQRTGNRQALPYAYLVAARLVGNTRVELLFTETLVTLSGRNLLPVYQQLIAQSVWRLEESGTGFDDPTLVTWIESITVSARPDRG